MRHQTNSINTSFVPNEPSSLGDNSDFMTDLFRSKESELFFSTKKSSPMTNDKKNTNFETDLERREKKFWSSIKKSLQKKKKFSNSKISNIRTELQRNCIANRKIRHKDLILDKTVRNMKLMLIKCDKITQNKIVPLSQESARRKTKNICQGLSIIQNKRDPYVINIKESRTLFNTVISKPELSKREKAMLATPNTQVSEGDQNLTDLDKSFQNQSLELSETLELNPIMMGDHDHNQFLSLPFLNDIHPKDNQNLLTDFFNEMEDLDSSKIIKNSLNFDSERNNDISFTNSDTHNYKFDFDFLDL